MPDSEHAKAESESACQAGLPSQGLRTALTLLLMWHLFAVAVALGSNFGTESPLRSALRRAPLVEPYLQLLDMDIAYDVRWTDGSETDQDHALIVESAEKSDGQPVVVQFPADDLQPGQRRRRLQMLAYHLAEQAQQENDALVSEIPQAVGAKVLADLGVKQVKLRCRAHDVQTPVDASAADRARSNPNAPRYYRDVYQANVFDSGKETLVMKIEQRRDVAPVANPPRPPGPPRPLTEGLP